MRGFDEQNWGDSVSAINERVVLNRLWLLILWFLVSSCEQSQERCCQAGDKHDEDER